MLKQYVPEANETKKGVASSTNPILSGNVLSTTTEGTLSTATATATTTTATQLSSSNPVSSSSLLGFIFL
jgi:hypothetical protein